MRSAPARLVIPLAGLLLAAAGPARAQTIGGIVRDSITHLPAQRVNVQVVGPDGAVLLKTATDTTGVFYAVLAAPARVRLRFDLGDGFGFATDTIVVGAEDFVQREFFLAIPRVSDQVHVEKQASQVPGTGSIRYPEELKQRDLEGEVLAEFVVDTTGRPIMETFRVLRASYTGFIPAVRAGLVSMRFYPAEVKGRKVKQVVQQPFTFHLSGPRPARSDSLPKWPPMQGPGS